MKLDTDNKPLYSHDCEDCKYLGSELVFHKPVDIYYCPSELPFPTMIVRHGSEGHQYSSCDVVNLMKSNPPTNIIGLMQRYYEDNKGGIINE